MSMKPIAMFASMIAVIATLTSAQAAPAAVANQPAGVSQDGSFQLAQWFPQPRHQSAACACVRGRG